MISLKDVLSTGTLPHLPFGVSRQCLTDLFGPPEDTGGTSRKNSTPLILKYGDVEFHFSPDSDGLKMIHIDSFSGPDGIPFGWGGLDVDAWIVRAGMPLQDFTSSLDDAGMAYSIQDVPELGQKIITTIPSAKIGFVVDPDEYSEFVGLAFISILC